MLGRTFMRNLTTHLLTLVVLAAFSGTLYGGSVAMFIDYDGDGINDLYSDGDNDGIPDAFEPGQPPTESEMTAALGDVFNVGELAAGPTDDLLSAYEGFCKRKFQTRALCQHRGGFNSGEEFGPGNGIGSGAMSSGCVGGICQ